MIIAIDFDGTIVEHRFPKVGPVVPHAIEWMRKFQSLGAFLILYTMRSDGRSDGSHPLRDAVEFCRVNGVEFWAVNENPDQHTWTGSPKVYAHAYIDDAAAGVPLIEHPDGGTPVVDWKVIGPLVEAMILDRQKKLTGVS